MTKTQALFEFMGSFGIPAFPSSSVPDDVVFPYLVYDPATTNRGQSISSTIKVFDYSESEASINAIADRIAKEIAGGSSVICDDGVICIYTDGGWSALIDENDSNIKGRTTNFLLIYNTL